MCAARMWRCAHRPPARVDRPGSNRQITDFLDFLPSNPSKSQSRLVVACGGMRRLLEWSLGAASDAHAALDGGLSARIGKRTAGNSSFSGLSSDPVMVILSLENGLRDSWIAKFSRCARVRTWGSAPPDQGTPSRTLTPVTLEGRRHPEDGTFDNLRGPPPHKPRAAARPDVAWNYLTVRSRVASVYQPDQPPLEVPDYAEVVDLLKDLPEEIVARAVHIKDTSLDEEQVRRAADIANARDVSSVLVIDDEEGGSSSGGAASSAVSHQAAFASGRDGLVREGVLSSEPYG